MTVNAGTIRDRSTSALGQRDKGVDRRDAGRRRGWGGAVVVLRAWESHVHGEGRQRVSQEWSCNVRRRASECWRRAGPDEGSAYYAVRRMQTKLHRWAGEEPSRRFGDLHNLVYDPAFLVHAWQRVASNAGARTPGVDKATVAWIASRIGVEA